jgi:ribosomal protein S14
MTGEMGTQIDRGYLPPETVADATSYLTRTGNADLLPILGLGDDPKVVKRATGDCPICGNKLPSHGVCRKRQTCRKAARELGVPA